MLKLIAYHIHTCNITIHKCHSEGHKQNIDVFDVQRKKRDWALYTDTYIGSLFLCRYRGEGTRMMIPIPSQLVAIPNYNLIHVEIDKVEKVYQMQA